MDLTCYIIDDEHHAIAHLEHLIEQTVGLTLAGSSAYPLNALKEIENLKPDISFIDIDMPGLSGIDLAGMVAACTHVIFTTAFREFGPEAYEKCAVDYLLKPVTYPRFWQSLEKVKQLGHSTNTSPDHFFIKTGVKGVLQRIAVQQLVYISGLSAYVELHQEREKLISYLSLQELGERLPPNSFLRIHKSYIVNRNFIQSVEGRQVRLTTGLYLPVGRSYQTTFEQYIQQHLLISKRS